MRQGKGKGEGKGKGQPLYNQYLNFTLSQILIYLDTSRLRSYIPIGLK